MKYGRLIYKSKYVNVGDYFQTFAIDYLYSKIGIDNNSVVEINKNNLKDYCGEKIKLPLNGHFIKMNQEDFFLLPNKIDPVFISFSRNSKIEDAFFKTEYIGCRDKKTYEEIIKKVKNKYVYINGCLTLTLPKRNMNVPYDKVYFVDAPTSVLKYIPEELKKDMIVINHEIEGCENPEEYSKKLLNDYYSSAKLVITSRLHCATPCLAAGIPVVLCRDYFDYRYTFLDKFITMYTPSNFADIDWNPKPINIESIKEKLFILFKMEITNTIDDSKFKEIANELTEMFLCDSLNTYKTPIYTKLFWKIQSIFPNTAIKLRKIIKKI